ncbi:MAG: hypothetical protein JWM59_1992 [Verrucomicrobiales bacterium]|nr:hypothetical protein [Verrucomicrobiales bacterium]
METSTAHIPFLGYSITLPWPLGLEGRLGEAALTTGLAHSFCNERLSSLRLIADLERHGGWDLALQARTRLEGNFTDAAKWYSKARALLGKARTVTLRELQAMRERIPPDHEELQLAAAAVVDWHDELPAAELLQPCGVIASWLMTVDTTLPRPHPALEVDTYGIDEPDPRQWSDPVFLRRVAWLTRLPWMNKPAGSPSVS